MSTPAAHSPAVQALAAVHGDVHVMPTSFAQQRFWFLSQLDADAGAYTLPAALRLRGPLDVGALEAALQTSVNRHEVLRTVFALEGEAPVQVVLPALRVPLPVTDLRALGADEREARVRAAAAANANADFDLARGPLVRASLLRVADDDHVLLLAVHHIVADGWSMGVLFAEIERAYAGGTHEPLALQYADFAVWQRKVLGGATAAKQLAYWTEQLRGLPPIELPTDRPRPAVLSSRGAKREVVVPAALADGVRQLARREGVTPYTAFLAAFATLLHRYGGQPDFAVAAITSGRRRPEVEPLVGLFVNTLPVRVDLDGAPTFAELMRRVGASATAAYANQDVPFDRIVDAVHPAHDRSRGPLAQVCCQLLEGLGRDPRLAGLEVSRVPAMKETSKFELTLMLHPGDDGALRAVMEYATDLFDASTVDRMLAHYVTLLGGIVRDPSRSVARLPLLDAAERDTVLARWNDAERPLPEWTVPARVLAVAAERPDDVAVRAGTRTLTYGALAHRSARLASRLAAEGVRAHDRVAVCVDRTPDMLVALLAVLRSGAAYVPVDASYPADRIAHVLEDSAVAAVVTDAASASALPATSAPVVRVDDSSLDGAAEEAFAAPPLDGESLAYVLYTSGSTGKPKGVMVPHRALANFLASMAKRPGLAAGDRLVAVTTLAFDIAGLELWLPLVTGARVELASREIAVDGARLVALVDETARAIPAGAKVMLQATPATWRLLLEAGWAGTPALTMLCGGEGWPPGLAASLLPRGAELWNVYGPTETTIWSTRARVTEPGVVPLGEPLANTTLYVLEPTGEPAPLGVPGELWIGGAGLAHGYHARPELTAERFVVHQTLGRLYRTGDLVRRRADGRLEYVGRLDDQIKLRGHRIELGEIESALAAQPEVAQGVVVVRPLGTPPEPQLVAFVVARAGASLGDGRAWLAAMRGRLRTTLPDYMLPVVVHELDALPLTPNGKVDRRALPTPADAPAAAADHVAPRTALEEIVVSAWREVLGRERVSVHDDFFALGGHSLAATRVAARLAELFGVSVPVRAMFDAPTPAVLAEWLGAHGVDDEMAALLSELDSMSDEEARALLETETSELT